MALYGMRLGQGGKCCAKCQADAAGSNSPGTDGTSGHDGSCRSHLESPSALGTLGMVVMEASSCVLGFAFHWAGGGAGWPPAEAAWHCPQERARNRAGFGTQPRAWEGHSLGTACQGKSELSLSCRTLERPNGLGLSGSRALRD